MKISVIMQVYLGDYPGARSNPKMKFVRAVHSFLAQTYAEKELIIVADRCPLTKKIYELLFHQEETIKFIYCFPDSTNSIRMYSSKEVYSNIKQKSLKIKFFRGVPKQRGLEFATGDIITYLDSDDIMLPNHLFVLSHAWSKMESEIKWLSNTRRILNQKVIDHPSFNEIAEIGDSRCIDLSFYGIHETYFINTCGNSKTQWPCASYTISHRKDIQVQWEDTEAAYDESGQKISGNSEDVRFVYFLCKNHGPGWWYESPSYVVCHYAGIYDN